MFTSLDDLRTSLAGGSNAPTPEYAAKMLHALPAPKSVDRTTFILDNCRDKKVLEYGASGALHEALVQVAAAVVGYDLTSGPGVYAFDLDDVSQTALPPLNAPPDIIVCGEVLEHLANPGWFLTRLRRAYPKPMPLIITVPNAYAAASQSWIKRGFENVNKDHVAWYSPKTLSVLLERSGYDIGELFYYNGTGPTAEGLIVVTE